MEWRTSKVERWAFLQDRLDLLQRWHRGCGSGPRDRETGGGAAEAHCLQRSLATGKSGGKATVEGVSRTGGLDHRATIEGGDQLGPVRGVEQSPRIYRLPTHASDKHCLHQI